MKIAIFTDTYAPDVNGVARILTQYTEYLDQNDFEFKIFAPDTKTEKPFSSHVHRYLSFAFFLYPECRIALPNYRKIKSELQRFKPDIIHIVTPFNIGLCGLMYAKKYDVPVVGSYHTNFDQYLAYYDVQFLSKFLWKYMRWFYKDIQKTFAPSMDTLEQLKKKGFRDLDVWGSGVDCDLFHPDYSKQDIRKKYGIKEKYIISYVGRLAPEKEADLLLKIASSLPEPYKDQIHWLITGDGPSKEEMEAKAPKNMTFTGFLNGEDLARIYSCADLFIFPSTTETFGNVVLEALSCGTPVVAAYAGGVKNIVTHNETGLFCEPRNIEQFNQAIISLLKNPTLRSQMEQNARNYALTQTWDIIFGDIINKYEDVLSQDQVRYA